MSASAAGHTDCGVGDHVGIELQLAPRQHDGGAVVAHEARAQDPIPGPNRTIGQIRRGCRARPIPVVAMYIPSHLLRSTTFVSPATMSTPAAVGGLAIAVTSAEGFRHEPFLDHEAAASAIGARPGHDKIVDGAVHREFADGAPGNSGLHNKCVGRHARARAPSSSRRGGVGSAPPTLRLKRPARRGRLPAVWVALPPAPCAMVMRSSRKRGCSLRWRSMRARTSSSKSATGPPAAELSPLSSATFH